MHTKNFNISSDFYGANDINTQITGLERSKVIKTQVTILSGQPTIKPNNMRNNAIAPKAINYPYAKRKSASFGPKLDSHIQTLQEWFNNLNDEAQRVFL